MTKCAETPDYTLKSYSNDYFTAQIPERFTNRSSTAGKGKPILLQQLFAAPGNATLSADQLALTVGVLPSGGIQELSDVQLRTRTARYTPATFSWLPASNVAFESADQGYELSVFLVHDKQYATIVASGLNDEKERLSHEMQLFVYSIRWQ